MRKYLKFSCTTFMCLATIVSFLLGGAWMWLPFGALIALAIIGDAFLAQDEDQPVYGRTWILDSFLYANFPLLLLVTFVYFVRAGVAAGGLDFDADLAAKLLPEGRLETGFLDVLGASLGLGLLYGVAATNVAHELVHRTWSPAAQSVGRWLLAFTWDGSFAIEHVYGHHRKVATLEDPASARRGETFYAFFLRSFFGSIVSAWQIESGFLAKKNRRPWSAHNRLLRGWLMSLTLAAVAVLLAGWVGLALHLVVAIYGKAYLELVNYIEHYGIVRSPKSPVLPRHSWNSNAAASSWFLYNLPRHSHHHATGHLPFWRLNAQPEAPTLPFGYMAMICIALVPSLFRRVMAPHVENWDRTYASVEERELAATVPAAS